jgi:uncharacterized protein YndB with AHSA1/START domain
MTGRGLAALLFALAFAPPALAQVVDASRQIGGERILDQSVVVAAPPARVWEAFTTAEGFTSWAVPVAKIDFRLGGLIETNYDPKGAPGAIANQIIAYAPERMLAFKNVRAPQAPGFDVAAFQRLHTVVLLDALPDGRTRVSIIQPGHGSDAAAKGVYDFFAAGNKWSLEQLKARFETGPVNWQAAAREAQPVQQEGR